MILGKFTSYNSHPKFSSNAISVIVYICYYNLGLKNTGPEAYKLASSGSIASCILSLCVCCYN